MSRDDVVIEDGDRIAQVVFMKIELPEARIKRLEEIKEWFDGYLK